MLIKSFKSFKSLQLLTFLFFVINNTSAQNVGIGTTNPAGKLHIDLTGAATDFAILIDDDDADIPTIRLRKGGISKAFMLVNGDDLRVGTYGSNPNGSLAFQTSSSTRMTLTPAGNIGIGITAPVGKLQIVGGTDAGPTQHGYIMLGTETGENIVLDNNEILARNNGAVATLFLGRDGSKVQLGNGPDQLGTKLQITSGTDVDLSNNNSGYIMMGSQTGLNMVMDINEIQARNNGLASDLFLQANGGKTQIGNTNWLSIEVENTTIQAYNVATPSELIVQPNGKTRIGGNSDVFANTKFQISEGVDAGLPDNTSGYMMIGLSNSTNVAFDNNEIQARNNGAAGDLFLQNDGGNLLLCGLEQGSVGIGIVSAASIPLGYMLAVDGKIISEEVKVQMSGSWPDYVFANNYKLRPLSELRKFITENKHLPGIPPAAEVEKNGIELGDMQKRMMEKIEELTLYILKLEDEIQKIKSKIDL
jgi:hypothetical protein